MKLKSEYENKLYEYFLKNQEYIHNSAKKIKKFHYSIPIDEDDLISFAYYKLSESENKLKYFQHIKDNKSNDSFFKGKFYTYMLTYCNIFKSKNHQVMNNVVEYQDDLMNDLSNENYDYEELFSFLEPQEFFVIYNIHINKLSRETIMKKMNISMRNLKKIENIARNKINKHFDTHF